MKPFVTGAQPPESVASRLHRARRFAGLSSSALADAVGVHRNTITRWENEHRTGEPTATEVARIAQALGVDASWLAGFTEAQAS